MKEKKKPLIDETKDDDIEPILASDVEKNNNDQKKKNSYIKYILNIVIVLIVTISSFCITFFTDYDTITSSFNNVDWLWILASFGLVVLAMLVRSLIYFCFARLYTRK